MRPVGIVFFKEPADAISCFPGAFIIMEVDLLIFDGSPQSFCENVVQISPPSIHAYFTLAGKNLLYIAIAGILASLIAVDNLGLG